MRLRFIVLSLIVGACLGAGMAFGAGVFFSEGQGRVAMGVSLGGIPVGGLTRAEAREVAEDVARLVTGRPLVLVYRDTRWVRDLPSLGARSDPDVAARRLMEVGRGSGRGGKAGLVRRARDIIHAATRGRQVSAVTSLDEGRLFEAMLSLADEINVEMRNATFDAKTGRPVPEREGVRLDVTASMRRVQDALSLAQRPTAVALVVRPVRPITTLSDLRELGIRELVASYSTVFDPMIEQRAHNIRLASGRISGVMVRPGAEFSFNEVVGPRTRELGFMEAPEIVGEEFRPGIGGGVCQVSSTLYSAALLANLKITARQNHSRLTGYVPPGRDATVYYGAQDLRFKNDTAAPILLLSEVSGSRLTVSIFGHKPDNQEVRIVTSQLVPLEPRIREIPDEQIPQGERLVEQQGSRGCEVTTERLVIRGEAVSRKEVISRDRYKPQDMVVRIGTGYTRPVHDYQPKGSP